MDRDQLLEICEAIQSTPTAPFHEYRVRETIRGLLANCSAVRLEEDAFGNLIARYGSGESPKGWAFGSHMDHPGWAELPEGAGFDAPELKTRGRFTFLGGVPDRYFAKAPPIEEFGAFAMWDLPEFEVRDGSQIHSRVCDDLIGCAAIVALLIELDRSGADVCCTGLFTRAEEVGFVGSTKLAESWPLPAESCFVSIETSIPVNSAEMGGGPMVRVGDRISIFDHAATASMMAAAEKRKVKVQRTLLDGGACEASGLQAFGIKTAGISVPLGNYHNCGPEDTIAAEFVEIGDVEGLLALMSAMVGEFPDGPEDQSPNLRERFSGRVNQHSEFIAATAEEFGLS
jgi:putative aminopeptidase FrvX